MYRATPVYGNFTMLHIFVLISACHVVNVTYLIRCLKLVCVVVTCGWLVDD